MQSGETKKENIETKVKACYKQSSTAFYWIQAMANTADSQGLSFLSQVQKSVGWCFKNAFSSPCHTSISFHISILSYVYI